MTHLGVVLVIAFYDLCWEHNWSCFSVLLYDGAIRMLGMGVLKGLFFLAADELLPEVHNHNSAFISLA